MQRFASIIDLAQSTSAADAATLVQELRPAIAAVNRESWQKPLLAFLELGANLGTLRQAIYRPLLSPFSRSGANRAELEAAAQRVKDGLDVLSQVRVFEEMGFEKTGLEKVCQEATNLLEKAKNACCLRRPASPEAGHENLCRRGGEGT